MIWTWRILEASIWVYQPAGDKEFSVELKPGRYRLEWFLAEQDVVDGDGRIEVEGAHTFKADSRAGVICGLWPYAHPDCACARDGASRELRRLRKAPKAAVTRRN
jgi:hypothetical protein